jgi:hypothetical protein
VEFTLQASAFPQAVSYQRDRGGSVLPADNAHVLSFERRRGNGELLQLLPLAQWQIIKTLDFGFPPRRDRKLP